MKIKRERIFVMRYYKFLTYFALLAIAIATFISGIQSLISSQVINDFSVLAKFGSDSDWVAFKISVLPKILKASKVYGVILILFAIYTLFVWKMFLDKRAIALILIYSYCLIGGSINLVYTLYIIKSIRGFLEFFNWGVVYIIVIVSHIVPIVIMSLINYIYFSRRQKYFNN